MKKNKNKKNKKQKNKKQTKKQKTKTNKKTKTNTKCFLQKQKDTRFDTNFFYF